MTEQEIVAVGDGPDEEHFVHRVRVLADPEPRRKPEGDERASGIQDILAAFLRNPVAAVEIVGFIGAAFGLYFALNKGIDEAKATSEQHYKDLASDFSRGIAEIKSGQAALTASDAAEIADIKALYLRGDTRYQELNHKLTEHDVKFGEMSSGINYIIKVLDGVYGPSPKDRVAPPR